MPRAASSVSRGGVGGICEVKTRAEELQRVVLAANSDGIDLLRRGKQAQAYEQLKFAEAVLAANPGTCAKNGDLLALTCSNLGCYYRKKGLPRASLRYLGRALRVEEAAGRDAPHDVCGLATTKLNACAALSGMGNHEEAEKMAVEATRLLMAEGTDDGEGGLGRDACSLLAVACHNLGAEREHLGQWGAAAVAFRHGAEAAGRALGPRSDLARSLADSCAEALEKAERHPTTLDHPARGRVQASPRRRPPRHGAVAKAPAHRHSQDFPTPLLSPGVNMNDSSPIDRAELEDEDALEEVGNTWRGSQTPRSLRLPTVQRAR